MSVNAKNFYVTGGTLQRDAACYVERRADAELYDALLRGRFCYVLTSRQMGKSSLMVRTAVRLREEGVTVAALDLTAIGQNLNPEQWYNGLLSQVGQRLDLEDEIEEFAYEHKNVGPLQRWMRALREIALERCKGKVVVFIDEIDVVRSLPFSTDEFFAGIREFYNRRSDDPELERLTFCLLGVAAPSDLIRDTRTTPFNIGQRIELNDFTQKDAEPLAQGLLREEGEAKRLLERILYWTNGHPFLTQRLCRAAAEDSSINSANDVDKLCNELFFTNRAKERDDNLLFVRERILRSEADIAGLLELYRRVRRGKRVKDDETNPLVTILRLSGIARAENGSLKVRNRIYEKVFDEDWVKQNMPDAELRRQRRAFLSGLMGASVVAAIIFSVIAFLSFNLKKQYDHNRRLLYASNISLAQQAWERADIARMMELLENQRPKSGEEDLRGFEWYYFWRLCNSDQPALQHNAPVHSIELSRDGKTLAAGAEDGSLKLWNAETNEELFTVKGHKSRITSVAFSPDGKTLATGSHDSTVKLWNVETNEELFTLKGHKNGITSVAFSPDGKTLATGSRDATVKLWDAATKQELAVFTGNTGVVLSVAFSPDGKTLATGSYGSVKLWNVNTKKELAALTTNNLVFYSVAFSPDGKTLAAGNYDGIVKLWDTTTKQELATLKGHTNRVRTVAFSPDGEVLATGSADSAVRLWSVATKEELVILRGHVAGINSLVFSPNGKNLLTGSDDSTVKLWDMSKEQELTILEGFSGGVLSVAFSPDGKILASGCRSGNRSEMGKDTVKLWDVIRAQGLATLKGTEFITWSVAFSPNGKILATTGSHVSTVKLWSVTAKEELATLKGHTGFVRTVAFSPDGEVLATGSSDSTVKLWSVTTKEELATLNGHKDEVSSLAFSPDGKVLATGSNDSTVKLWSVTTKEELAVLKGSNAGVVSIAFNPDGEMLAIATKDNIVKLWNLKTRQETIALKGKAAVLSMVFSSDGKKFVTGSRDNSVKLWDVATWQELAVLKRHLGPVNSVAFSPDGKTLAAGSDDGTVGLWSAATEEEVIAKSKKQVRF